MAHVDMDYQNSAVPQSERRGYLTMFMIMLGFTFFSASMWTGQVLSNGLNFNGFLGALLLGGLILGLYTGILGYIGAESGLSLDLLAVRSFGIKGSYLPSALIAFTQCGWFGVGLAMFAIPIAQAWYGNNEMVMYGLVLLAGICMTCSAYYGIKSLTIISYIAVPCVAILGTAAMIIAAQQGNGTFIENFAKSTNDLGIIGGAGLVIGSFVSGGTATPNFTRYAKGKWTGFWTTVIAFFIGNSLMFFFGAVANIYVGGNDIFDVMRNLGMFWTAILVLGLNIWTTNDNAIYTTGLGLANITGFSKRSMVLFSGALGTVAAVWLYWNFCGYLSILNATLPPIGIILALGYFINKEKYNDPNSAPVTINYGAVLGVIVGAVIGNLTSNGVLSGVPSINAMISASIIYLLGNRFQN
ncbi:MAG: cytosine permease [Acidaminococcaceae bacterium]|nr:cytosine permease [Acidaminococcaceae bacterium]MDO4935092.1 cytosine permease [Phascolarctobacterium sp.]